MPEKSGQFHLNTILREAALCPSPSQMDIALSVHLPDEWLRRELVTSNWALRSAYSQGSGSAGPSDNAHVMLNAIRVNTVVTELCRPALDDRIEQLIAHGGCITDFIGSLVRKAKTFLADPHDGVIHLDALMAAPVSAPKSVQVTAGGEVDCRYILSSLPDFHFGGAERRKALIECGEHA
jgi:hypothetical protein